MAERYDWGLDSNGDLNIQFNDFTYVLSDEQHIQDTIIASPLWWKQFPADGVSLRSYLNSGGQIQVIMSSIKKNLQNDGYNCNNPIVAQTPNGLFEINPNATRL